MTIRRCSLLLLVAATMFVGSSDGFYIPGVQPQSFQSGDAVEMKVNAMTSVHTQIPRDYYKLPFCAPGDGPKMASENLGEFLTGNKIQSSPYIINMKTEVFCKVLCQKTITKVEENLMKLHIQRGYHHNWIIDNLPSANIGVIKGKKRVHYSGGFPIGFIQMDKDLEKEIEDRKKKRFRKKPRIPMEKFDAYVYNHVNINIDYTYVEGEGYRVVAFAVEPLSVNHHYQGGYEWDGIDAQGLQTPLSTCQADKHLARGAIESSQPVREGEKILYTYDVIWQYSNVQWSSRWDIYLNENHLVPAQVHWYSITNSILVVLFLSLLVISILVRNLKRDIAAYNALATFDEDEEADDAPQKDEKGWKLVHADVFRPPDNFSMLYCVFVASGVQLCVTAGCAIMLSAVGFLSPARRGSLMNALLAFYTLCGVFSGYVSSRLYKAFRGRQWQLCTVITATLFPGIFFSVFIVFNIILAFLKSSGSAPFLDLLIVAAMWCCVAIPLNFIGAYFGYKQEMIQFPTVTSTIARAIPTPPLYLNPLVGMVFTGLIPFAAAYVELFFIMTSLWMDQFYYVFGFTLGVYLILILTCAEITLLAVYYQLCAENHRWWWFSFFASGSSALYVFLYSVFWFKALEASSFMTYVLYFGYMSLISVGIMLIFGSVGSITSFWFVRMIFSSIKVD